MTDQDREPQESPWGPDTVIDRFGRERKVKRHPAIQADIDLYQQFLDHLHREA